MFPDGRREKAYLWYARFSELKRIEFWQSVTDEVRQLQFRRDPASRVGRLNHELEQLERELGKDYLRSVATQERWSGLLPDWLNREPPRVTSPRQPRPE